MKSYLNLGCGHRYHPSWTNIDITSHDANVIPHDLSQGIPLSANTCDVVYHSAALEHMRQADALQFLRECHRVLRPGGIIRVAVPDLEKLCTLYLEKLKGAASGDTAASRDYEWIMLELFDQTVREETGGAMLAYFRQDPIPNERFVFERIGDEARDLIQAVRRPQSTSGAARGVLRKIRRGILSLILGSKGVRAWEIGRFRMSGEVHQWMYDRYSLSRILIAAGFTEPQVQSPVSSRIPNWTSYNLDTLADGTVVKPDLFYMEATKPQHA